MKKKVLWGLALVVMLLILVGCGKKNNSNTTDSGNNSSNENSTIVKNEKVLFCSHRVEKPSLITEITYYFENNQATNMHIKYTYDLSKDDEKEKNAFISSKVCESDAFKVDIGLENCEEKLEGDNYIVTGFPKVTFNETKGSYEDVNGTYTEDGWACEEK